MFHSQQLARRKLVTHPKRWRTVLIVLHLLLLSGVTTLVVHAQQPSPTYDPTQVTPPTQPPLALVGEGNYQQNCAPCHGAQGMGDGPTAADLPGPATAFADPEAIWALSPSELFHTTKFGRIQNLMPPWGNQLTDEQIWQAVAYAWSLHTTPTETETGAALYAESCAVCHGDGGAGDGPEAAVDLVDFTDLDYAIANSQAAWYEGWQQAHPELGAEWDDEQQTAVLEYIRTFSYVPPWDSAYRAGNAVIEGTVVQGTPDGLAVADLPVTLEAYAGFTPVAVFTTTVSADGIYTFTALSADPNINYLASVSADGIRYSSAILNFEGTEALSAPITIYGTTNDPSALRMNSVHWIVDPRPGTVVIVEVYGAGNAGDLTYVGQAVDGLAQPGTVAISVPANAVDLGFENGLLGERFLQSGDQVYDTAPVLPGEGSRQIIMRYRLPQEGRTAMLTRNFNYPVDEMSLLIAELPEVEVEIPGFALASRQDFQGQTYQLWRPEAEIPETLTVRMSGLLAADAVDPRAAQGGGQVTTTGGTAAVAAPQLGGWLPWSIVGLLLVGIVGIAIWSAQSGRLGGRGSVADHQTQRAALLERIAHLDDQHALGEIDEQAWQDQRARLKAQLLAIASNRD